jgi:hypothetical protein
MGLTIHYSLRTSLRHAADMRLLVETMHQHARHLPFRQIGNVFQFQNKAADSRQSDEGEGYRWLKIQATASVTVGDERFDVQPQQLIGFRTSPGEGCEEANFGFCQYPSAVSRPAAVGRTRNQKTGLDDWRWSSFCKTQYASDPGYGGVANFLRCHLSVVKLLDFARSTGLVTVEVQDEGGYWEHRDLEKLAREVGDWNEMIAAVVGTFKDQAEKRGTVLESAIAHFPNFEHLEAQGRRRLADLLTRLRGRND